MGSNFDVKIDSHIIEKIYNINYYSYTTFKNFSVGVFLIRELQKAKEIVEANPHIGKKVQTNKYKYVMSSTKAILYYEIIENSRNIIFYDYKPFKQNKDLYVLYLTILLLLLLQVMFDQYILLIIVLLNVDSLENQTYF